MIPWRRATAHLTVKSSWRTQSSSLLVDGKQIAVVPRPTRQNPWIETVLDQDEKTLVVRAQRAAWDVDTLVFVDGLCLQDGRSLDAWRSTRPVPLDEFEASFRGLFWSPRGALLFGLAAMAPGLVELERNPNLFWIALEAGAFIAVAGWWMCVLVLIRWLRSKRAWPSRLRRLVVMLVAPFGSLVVVLLLGQLFYVIR